MLIFFFFFFGQSIAIGAHLFTGDNIIRHAILARLSSAQSHNAAAGPTSSALDRLNSPAELTTSETRRQLSVVVLARHSRTLLYIHQKNILFHIRFSLMWHCHSQPDTPDRYLSLYRIAREYRTLPTQTTQHPVYRSHPGAKPQTEPHSRTG